MDYQQNKTDDIAYFLSFCIENYRNKHGITGEEAYNILSQSGTLKYLQDNYEVIHTQSHQWILQDIDNFIKHSKI